ncbi:MAG: PAS domain S-box protein [Deltaproteobacteria bacterium]|nr:MAG: PAS domain S-box protein [Deltaproteobacteria bacterium]
MDSNSRKTPCKSEKAYCNILNEIEEGYFETDLQGNFTFFNHSMCRILGYPSEKLLGANYREFASKRTAKEMFQTYNRIFRTGEPVRIVDYEIKSRNDRRVVVELSSSMIRDIHDTPIGFRGIVRDITEKIQAEEEKEQLKLQLQQALRLEAVGTLAGGIAHDFNNILTSIQGYTSILKLRTGPSHPNYEKLTRIDDLIQNGADLTRQLLGFALGGKYEIKILNINTVMLHSLKMIPGIKENINIVEDYQNDLWMVEADRGQVEQSLLNLFTNAVHAMPDGGTLSVKTCNIHLDPDHSKNMDLPPGKYLEISIADTGIGMNHTTMQKIFEPFFTTKKMGRGTGLGLASTYGIIRNHHGKIMVSSRVGVGSTFTIYLPASSINTTTQMTTENDYAYGSENLLLIDNEQTILDIGKEILQELGYAVFTADSGEKALEIYKKHKDQIALVILDMIMPGMSGIETYHELKKINSELPIILDSGYNIETQAIINFMGEKDGFVQKPFNIKILSRKIRTLLDRLNRKTADP